MGFDFWAGFMLGIFCGAAATLGGLAAAAFIIIRSRNHA